MLAYHLVFPRSCNWWDVSERRPVVIVPYNADWPSEFKALESVYVSALGGLAARVQHVGSTSVPGLSAKPIIDIDVVIEHRSILNEVIAARSQQRQDIIVALKLHVASAALHFSRVLRRHLMYCCTACQKRNVSQSGAGPRPDRGARVSSSIGFCCSSPL